MSAGEEFGAESVCIGSDLFDLDCGPVLAGVFKAIFEGLHVHMATDKLKAFNAIRELDFANGNAAFTLLGGQLSDRFDAKRIFLAGLGIFGLASLLAAVAGRLQQQCKRFSRRGRGGPGRRAL